MAKSPHSWPTDGQCLYGPWKALTGPPKATEYRQCVHPNCHKFEERPTAKA